ncbi:MAG: polyprenyl synthetase family protein [bacterium]|nr:polyprenyl synthetase family protein [bacterium]
MPESGLKIELVQERRAVESALRRRLRTERGVPRRLRDAMRHSVLAGGKRLRPVLMLWCWDALAGERPPVSREAVLTGACGLEMLHTYSLIHDDLPAMDDDVLRRGRPTCHVAFDEATAILAGDGLQALGLVMLAEAGGALGGRLVELVGGAVGPAGMVGGQQEDLDAEGAEVTAALVRRIHRGKTAALISAAVAGGALLAGADARQVKEVAAAGMDLGLAFQGADDVLDATATSEQLGKTAGKDATAGKATWVAIEGLPKAARRAHRDGRRGLRRLAATLPAGPGRERLLALGEIMWLRDR